jgi:hypothetical protein
MRRFLPLALLAVSALADDSPQALLLRQSSGTAMNPASAGMAMTMAQRGNWLLMLHGAVFLEHANDSGPRGAAKTFSTNWLMGSASRRLGGGALLFRSMLSLEPATIRGRKYPELFQTGETAFGKQLIDGQHPHDFFMELAAEYARPLGRRATGYLYLAPVGDPALGPVAFPHRDSASELPQAPISHHFLDSTHIAYDVITAGVDIGAVTAEASAFHGGEPDENRWNVHVGRIDSWSARLQLHPTANLAMQVSTGRLTKPEFVEPGYMRRTTVSLSYVLPLERLSWSSTLAWGEVYKEVHDRTLLCWLGETSVELFERHHFTARIERGDKDELFPHPIFKVVPRPPIPIRVFRVQATTVGYSYDLLQRHWGSLGAGANVTSYQFPAILEGFYGPHPHAVLAFLHARLGTRM